MAQQMDLRRRVRRVAARSAHTRACDVHVEKRSAWAAVPPARERLRDACACFARCARDAGNGARRPWDWPTLNWLECCPITVLLEHPYSIHCAVSDSTHASVV